MCAGIYLSPSQYVTSSQEIAMKCFHGINPFGGFARAEKANYWRPRIIDRTWLRIYGFTERDLRGRAHSFRGEGLMQAVLVRSPKTNTPEVRIVTRPASKLVIPIHNREPFVRWNSMPIAA